MSNVLRGTAGTVGCDGVGEHMTRAVAGLLAIALAGAAAPAFADSYCGPGRHVGSENDGPGKSWVCLPDGFKGSPTGRQYVFETGPTQASRIAAGMALGAAGLDLVSALVGILGRQSSGPTEAERRATENRRQQEANAAAMNEAIKGLEEYQRAQENQRQLRERAEAEAEANAAFAKEKTAAYADEGFKAARMGNYVGAFSAFRHAYELSGYDDRYQRNMVAMEALLHLQEALALTAEKKTAQAYTEFFKAETLAREASRSEIAERIEAYRIKLFADIRDSQKTAPGAAKPTTKCMSVNGEFVCD